MKIILCHCDETTKGARRSNFVFAVDRHGLQPRDDIINCHFDKLSEEKS